MAETDIFDDVAAAPVGQPDDIFSDVAKETQRKTPPMTFESLHRLPQTGPTLTERATHLGEPSPAVQSFAPKNYDLTKVPRSPFTNQLEPAPPIRTVEETGREGVIGPREQTLGERVGRALGAGAPEGSRMTEWTGQRGTKDNLRLFAPEELMTESEQRRHPILTGAGEFAGGFTSPEGVMLLAGTAGAGQLAGPAGQTVKQLLAAGFTAQMLSSAAQQVPEVAKAIQSGDTYNAKRLLTHLGLTAATAGLAARGMLEEPTPLTVPRGAISSKLAMDEATTRGARRLEDFQANEAARRGMGNLAEAERGIEAGRQARIAAPVEPLKSYEGPPPILTGRPLGPERNPLEVEAAQVREQQAARQTPGFNVLDMRRVALPEEPGQAERPPYFEIAPPIVTQPKAAIAAPMGAEALGLRGRSAHMGDLASRTLRDIESSPLRKFGPDVLEEARQELQAAAGLAGSFERPGRYFAELGQTDVPYKEDPKYGIRYGGAWYGVTSARPSIQAMHPWYTDVLEGPETLSRIAEKGKGAAYDRILERVATHIQNERESARPVVEEFAPQLRTLADQVRDVDPDLSQTLSDLAGGKAVGFHNLRAYIEEKITNAHAAAEFSRAIDEAAAEARGEAGAEETVEPGGATRERESAPARELDFEPLPESQPISYEDAGKRLGLEYRGVMGAEYGDKAAIVYQDPQSKTSVAVKVGEWSPERLQEKLTKARESMAGGEGILPGMEGALEEQRAAVERERGRQLSEEINRPPESIEGRAGVMERESPLFRGTKASPQREMFRPGGDIFDDVAAERPQGKSGTTFYSNAFLDPKVWRDAFPGVTKALARFGAPELTPGDLTKGILREQTGELVRRKEQLYKALEAKAGEWDARPGKEQIDFILREQRGQKQANSADQIIADRLREMFADRREQIENLGHGAFQRWRENYFPQMWERPNQVRDWITQVLGGKRRMEGPASFKKQRVFEDIQEGIDAGFKPLTTNPITLALAKLHEMDRYTMAHSTLDSMKKAGVAKAVMVGQQAPAGWERLSEGIGTIYGGGDIPVKEAYDKAVWDRLSEVAKNLGIEHNRAVGIGGTRLGYATPGEITTRFATPESVIAHEIGHNLDWKYGLKDQLVKNKLYAKELRALADLHIEGMSPADVPQSFQRYIRKGEEKMATMVEALIHAPDKFREVAPNTWDFLNKFIADRPELKPLTEAKPSLRYDTRTSPVSAGGIVIHGYYYAPAEAASVFNNYLSPGLQGFKTYNAVRMVGNTLNQAQLGLSAFHLGFTSIDASVSDMALALERLSRGEVGRAMTPAMRSVSVLGSPINTLLKGNRLLREYIEPGKFAEMAKLADAVAEAGGRVHMDPYYKNQAIESFWKAWKEGNYGKAGLKAFPAAMEYAAKPVMEYAVPRMKLGVFANLAEDVLARSDREEWTPAKTRFELNRAWDSVDNRMGQIVYDNLFWNRAVKDLGLVSVRSLGWNLGTAREIGGGAVDTTRQLARLAAGEKAELTHRMAYVMALPIVVGFTGALVHYLSTGKKPETLTDYYFPQTGKIGPNGRPERLSLPSYVKDIVELNQHPTRTVLNKVHPAITATAQFLRNEDYYGTEIHHPDDSFLRQRLDDAEFVAKQFLPFSIRNAYQRAESAGGTGIAGPVEKRSLAGTLESMVGLVPAPRSLMQTSAERLAHEDAIRNMPQGPRTREQFEHSQLLRSYENRLSSSDIKLGDLRQEVASGRITARDAETIARTSRLSPIERDFNRLPLKEALDVWDEANAEEKKILRPLLVRKQVQLGNMPREERQAAERRMREALYGATRIGLLPGGLGYQRNSPQIAVPEAHQ